MTYKRKKAKSYESENSNECSKDNMPGNKVTNEETWILEDHMSHFEPINVVVTTNYVCGNNNDCGNSNCGNNNKCGNSSEMGMIFIFNQGM